jgi:four helix bundle protein
MATIKRFEDVEAWQLARELSKEIYKITGINPFSFDYRLKDQIKGSSGSMMDNIAEGFERDGRKEFITFLSYGKGSAGEFRSQLYRALDAGHITQEKFDELFSKAEKYSKMVSGLMKYLNASEIKGKKYMPTNIKP